VQPTDYVRNAWRGRPYGRLQHVNVAAAHDGDNLYLRLTWPASATGTSEFPDAAGILFPATARAPLLTLGRPRAPVELWRWQADRKHATSLLSIGPGIFKPGHGKPPRVTSSRRNELWSVVFSSRLAGALAAGKSARVGVVIWDGSNGERGGLAAVTPRWLRLEIAI
jgi:DMSO reductase family type II enzyme heme b subunit